MLTREQANRFNPLCYRYLLAFARARVPRSDADDLVSRTFLTAWERRDQFRAEWATSVPDLWQYSCWMRTILLGHIANYRRISARRIDVEMDDNTSILLNNTPAPLRSALDRDSILFRLAALTVVSDRDKWVFWTYIDLGSTSCIASAVGVSARTVRRIVRRVADALVKHEPYCPPDVLQDCISNLPAALTLSGQKRAWSRAISGR